MWIMNDINKGESTYKNDINLIGIIYFAQNIWGNNAKFYFTNLLGYIF